MEQPEKLPIQGSPVVTEDIAAKVTEATVKFRMIGVIICIRQILPHFIQHEDSIQDSAALLERLLQVYELCLHLLTHSDQGIVTHALETLQQLLKTPPTILKHILVSAVGIRKNYVFDMTNYSEIESEGSTPSSRKKSGLVNVVPESEHVEDIDDVMHALKEKERVDASLDKITIQILPESDPLFAEGSESTGELKDLNLQENNQGCENYKPTECTIETAQVLGQTLSV
mgnify:CR=1 FL=1